MYWREKVTSAQWQPVDKLTCSRRVWPQEFTPEGTENGPRAGCTPGNSWWGCAVRFSPHFRPKMLSSTPVFRPGLWAEIMLSLLRLERKQKNSSNPFGICIFLFLSYSFGIETINTFIHSRSSLKNHNDSRPKWTKCIPVFRPNRRKNPTRWGGACLAYIREYPGRWQIACGNSCIRQWRIETFR